MQIRSATEQDFEAIWNIFHAVIQTGDTYAWAADTSKEEAYQVWLSPGRHTYVATIEGQIVGAYFLRPNQPGLGSHVANAAYMVNPKKQGLGIGKCMGEHSILEAKRLGYLAMQFNFVVSTNQPAVALWKKLGFRIIGTSPKSFRHAQLGLVDAYIMYRAIDYIPS